MSLPRTPAPSPLSRFPINNSQSPTNVDQDVCCPDARKQHRFAHIPFSSGSRFCIGESFAKLEAVLILAMVAQRFEVDLVPGQQIDMRSLGTLRPAPGVNVILKPR